MQTQLSVLEMEELRNRTKGMTNQEREYAIKFYRTSEIRRELDRRTETTIEVLRELFEILDRVKSDTSLEDMQMILSSCKQALKME